jgi:hypothetical protein
MVKPIDTVNPVSVKSDNSQITVSGLFILDNSNFLLGQSIEFIDNPIYQLIADHQWHFHW